MRMITIALLLLSTSLFAETEIVCYQHCPEGQICESAGFSFRLNESKTEVKEIHGSNGKVLSYKLSSKVLKVKLDSDYGPVRHFKVKLKKIGGEGPSGRVTMLGLLRFKVFCEEITDDYQ